MSIRTSVDRLPLVYLESRDFQLLARVWNMLFLGKYQRTKGILNVLNPLLCPARYLEWLRDRLGFEPKTKIESKDMRVILTAFPWLIKNKGSMRAIDAAVRLSLMLQGVNPQEAQIFINGENAEIQIFFDREVDSTILSEIFRHIAPVGFTFSFTIAQTDARFTTLSGDSVVFVGEAARQTLSSLRNQPYVDEMEQGRPALGDDDFEPTTGYGEVIDAWAVGTVGIQEITDDEVNDEGNITQLTDSGELPTSEG